MTLAAAPGWLAAGPHRQQGEFVLVLGPGEEKRAGAGGRRAGSRPPACSSLPASEAAKLAAQITGVPQEGAVRVRAEAAEVKRATT